MPKMTSHRDCYPPGTFQDTDLRYRLNHMRSNHPYHPHSDGHGDNHNRPHYQNFGARPKTFPNGRSSCHSGSQSYHQQQPRHSGVSGPRNKPRHSPSLAQYNISHRTVIVNHSSTDPDASPNSSSVPDPANPSAAVPPSADSPSTPDPSSSAPSSNAASKEPNDDSHLDSTYKDMVSLLDITNVDHHEEPIAVEPKFKDASTMTTIYYNRNRSDLEVYTHIAVMEFLGISQKDASTQTRFRDLSNALLDCFTNSTAPNPDEFSPLTPASDPSTPSCAADVFSLDGSYLNDSTFFPVHRKGSYDVDLETLVRTAPDHEITEPVPNLLVEETKTMLKSLSLSGVPTDLLSYLDQTPILPSNTCTIHNPSSNLPPEFAMDTASQDEFTLIPEFTTQFVPDAALADDANLDESL